MTSCAWIKAPVFCNPAKALPHFGMSTSHHYCLSSTSSFAGKEVEETLRVVDEQTKEAAAKKEIVEGEEAIASEKAAAAKAIKVWLHLL